MSDGSETIDREVLRRRGLGQAYARISRELGLGRAAEAQRAFRRALELLSVSDARQVRTEEISRLNELAKRVRADTDKSDADRTRQLQAIERMQNQISDET